MFRKLDDNMFVAAQIDAADVGRAADDGVTLVINNRPDDEEEGQPTGSDIAAAARGRDVTYAAIPVTHSGFSHAQIDAMAAALAGAEGPVLAYCRSGTRSTFLWALARAKSGDDPDRIAACAARAGYDVAPIRALLDALAAG